MLNNNPTDRRIFARIPISLPIRFLAYGQEKECMAKTVDISANGIGLVCEEKLSPQTSLEMWLELPENRSPFYTRGEVIWSHPSADRAEYRTGVHLEKAELMGLAPILWR
jgi:hypothetical protein